MPSSSAAQAQITALAEGMNRGFTEVKFMLQGFDERLRSLETREAGCQPIVQTRIDAAWRRLDEHDTKLNQVLTLHQKLAQDQILMTSRMKDLQGILKWVLGVFTGILLSILGALATGQATIVFK
jgi:hypothetical protein